MVPYFWIMELLWCDCKKKCEVGTCKCIDMGMRCTDLCQLQKYDYSENNKEDDDAEVVSDYMKQIMTTNRKAMIKKSQFLLIFLFVQATIRP